MTTTTLRNYHSQATWSTRATDRRHRDKYRSRRDCINSRTSSRRTSRLLNRNISRSTRSCCPLSHAQSNTSATVESRTESWPFFTSISESHRKRTSEGKEGRKTFQRFKSPVRKKSLPLTSITSVLIEVENLNFIFYDEKSQTLRDLLTVNFLPKLIKRVSPTRKTLLV